jgi:hypothetical protein
VTRSAHLPEQSLIFARVALKVFVNIVGHFRFMATTRS